MTQALSWAELLPGTILGSRFRIVRLLKIGSYSAVYESFERDRYARALKVMAPHIAPDTRRRERFKVEATVTKTVASDHLVQVFEADIDLPTELPFIVMELLVGEDVGAILKSRGRIPVAEIRRFLTHAALALDKMHQVGVVHGALTPARVFITAQDDNRTRAKVLGFGMCRILAEAGENAHSEADAELYLAPEQLRPSVLVGRRADTVALAHIAHTLLLGEPYWAEVRRTSGAGGLKAAMQKGAQQAATLRAAALGVALPSAFDAWFAKAVAPDPTARFESASAMIAALDDMLDPTSRRSSPSFPSPPPSSLSLATPPSTASPGPPSTVASSPTSAISSTPHAPHTVGTGASPSPSSPSSPTATSPASPGASAPVPPSTDRQGPGRVQRRATPIATRAARSSPALRAVFPPGTANMATRTIGNIMVVAHTSRAPSESEWDAYLRALGHVDMSKLRTVVFTDGGAPNAAQRDQMKKLFRGAVSATSILSNNTLVRGIVTAISWFNPRSKAFSMDAMDEAFDHLELSPSEREAVLRVAEETQAELVRPTLWGTCLRSR